MKKTILLHFLHLFQSKQLEQDHLVVSLQMLILPMLTHTFQNGQNSEVIDAAIIKTIVDKLLDPPEEVFLTKNSLGNCSCLENVHMMILFFAD